MLPADQRFVREPNRSAVADLAIDDPSTNVLRFPTAAIPANGVTGTADTLTPPNR